MRVLGRELSLEEAKALIALGARDDRDFVGHCGRFRYLETYIRFYCQGEGHLVDSADDYDHYYLLKEETE